MRDESDQVAEDQRKCCETCGQWFDTRDLDQVFHHDAKPHDTLTSNDQ